MLKKKSDEAEKAKKKSFVVRHIKHNPAPVFAENESGKGTKEPNKLVRPAAFEEKPEKRVTRASARLASNSTAQGNRKALKKPDTRRGPVNQNKTTSKVTKNKASLYMT